MNAPRHALAAGGDPLLLTPGPLTTAPAVREAMLRDWGSRDPAFIALTRRVRERLVALAGGEATHTAVPIQGSGTFAVEAMIGTFMPPDGKVLVLVNGAYGRRILRICACHGHAAAVLETPEDRPVASDAIAAALAADDAVTHVALVHCETTTGVLNPLAQIAAVVAGAGRRLLVDSMSAFGALPIDARTTPFDALAASANKCLEGAPGLAFVICRTEALARCRGRSASLSLDLHDQWQALEATGQWRFTPPTHVLAALDRALEALAAEGGVAGRGARYRANCRLLVDGMRRLGFEPLLADDVQAPVIVTFRMPADPRFAFDAFYNGLRALGYVIYPGKLASAESFRIGCIGSIGEAEIRGALAAVAAVLAEMGVASGAPARAQAGAA